MSQNLRRSQHHQRRKEHQTASGAIGSVAPRYKSVSTIPRQALPARNSTAGRWTPWMLDSKGMFYWSAMRRSDGTVEYAYCDNLGQPLQTQPPAPAPMPTNPIPAAVSNPIERVLLPITSTSSPEVQSSGLRFSPGPQQQPYRQPAFPSVSFRPMSSGAVSSPSSSSTGSYISQWYQDLQQEGVINERRKLDMRVSRWLASLA